MLPKTIEAHKKEDTEFLKKVYDFAEWCYHSKEDDNSNAVAVSFYEDLVKDKIMDEMIKWVSQDIINGIFPLWKFMLSKQPESYKHLIKVLEKERKSPKIS